MTIDDPASQLRDQGRERSGRFPRWVSVLALSLALAFGLLIRFAVPAADPYKNLDWDTGILTDEGFYMHNARNDALFGTPRLDEFNNMLVSPVIHFLQVKWFQVNGVSSVSARILSILLGLPAIVFFAVAMRLAFGKTAGALAALFMLVEHTYALFNRLALLDTPGTTVCCAAFLALAVGQRGDKTKASASWLFAGGALVGIAIVVRSLCVYLVMVTFAVSITMYMLDRAPQGGPRIRGLMPLAGLLSVGCVYVIAWYVPNERPLAQMNRYYRTVQIVPHTTGQLLHNLTVALWGRGYGTADYLALHSPVLFLLALWCCTALVVCRIVRSIPALVRPTERLTILFLSLWLVFGWALLAVSNYAPDRYLVTLFPPLAGLAAVCVQRFSAVCRVLSARGLAPGLSLTLPAAIIGWHICYTAFANFQANLTLQFVVAAAGAAVSAGAAYCLVTRCAATAPRRVILGLLLAFLCINGAWLANWAMNISYSRRSANAWLAANLPERSVLLGDVAPGISMDTRLIAVNVMRGLCNDVKPVERYESRPAYIVMIDGPWKSRYWTTAYPQLVTVSRRLHRFRIIKWWVGVYPAVSSASEPVPEVVQLRKGLHPHY